MEEVLPDFYPCFYFVDMPKYSTTDLMKINLLKSMEMRIYAI